MVNQASSAQSRRPRNIRIIIGRVLLVIALCEIAGATLAVWNWGSLFGATEQHYFSDGLIWALVGIGFMIDGTSGRRLASS